MYKKAMSGLLVVNLIFMFGSICVRGISQTRQACVPACELKLDERVLAKREESTIGIVDTAVSGQRIVDVQTIEKSTDYLPSDEDLDMLMRIVEAEAGNQDEDGKLLVANVVLNRVASEKFPDNVTDVVLQKDNGVSQFSPVSNGSIWSVKISQETGEAVERALEGEDISEGALYFVARKYADSEKLKWFDRNLTFLFEHGGHEFFR
jgi:spore germination cell wall hydrolase CwlJ-like protein